MNRPMTCLINSLIGPLRGMRAARAGKADSNRYGRRHAGTDGSESRQRRARRACTTAHAAAAPISGAVQGVESTAVMTPNPAEPATRFPAGG